MDIVDIVEVSIELSDLAVLHLKCQKTNSRIETGMLFLRSAIDAQDNAN